jgi:hypothetical protein
VQVVVRTLNATSPELGRNKLILSADSQGRSVPHIRLRQPLGEMDNEHVVREKSTLAVPRCPHEALVLGASRAHHLGEVVVPPVAQA